MKTYLKIDDTDSNLSYTALIFPGERVVVVFPSDPLGPPTYGYAAHERRDQIMSQAHDLDVFIDWRLWRQFEVRPDPDRLWVRTFTLIVSRRWIFDKAYTWRDTLERDFDFTELDQLARDHGLPTINEYYAGVQTMRDARRKSEDDTIRMLESWTDECPVEELLSRLRRDLTQNLNKIREAAGGRHYVLCAGGQRSYFKTPSTETLLRSFIFHAEDCFRRGIPVRFDYCLPEHKPAGIEYQMSPIQD